MAKPLYIDRGGEQVYPPPFSAKNVGFFAFGVDADRKKLQAICDRYLNGPLGAGRRFRPALAQAIFVFNTIEALRAETEGWRDRGWFPEEEAAVWLPLLDMADPLRVYWFHPYMLVDNSYALSMGREIYGFPKALGWFVIPSGPNAPARLSVETLAVAERDVDEKGQRALLFAVCQSGEPNAAVPAEREFRNLPELMPELVELAGLDAAIAAEGLSGNLIDDLISGNMPMVFLKQFRDGADPTRCCYQAIQKVVSKLVKLHNARIYRQGYVLEINNLASHPIRAELGLPNTGPVPVKYSFWMSFDFYIGPCEIVWSSCP